MCVFIIPPPFYFQFSRFTAGLPQQYLAFDPDRYLAGVPQRSGLFIAFMTVTKFIVGVSVVWLFYGIAHVIRSGRPSSRSATS